VSGVFAYARKVGESAAEVRYESGAWPERIAKQ